jgi:histidinol-phosphate/aromatic aminotransferase/cobyric acid decarboxylase-like protein
VGDAAAVRTALFRQKLIVRDCTSFGLPYAIRIAMQLPEQNARLVAVLRALAPSMDAALAVQAENKSG